MHLVILVMVLGIVGKIGSGKSYLVKYMVGRFKDSDIKVFSCDDIAKDLIESGKTSYTGGKIMPYIFFTNENLQEEIRNTLHPEVFNKINDDIAACRVENPDKDISFIIETALPSELFYKMCDKVIYIRSSYENSYKRLKENRGYADNQIKLIYNSQEYYEKFYNMADYIIDNDGDKETLNKKIDEVLNEIYLVCK